MNKKKKKQNKNCYLAHTHTQTAFILTIVSEPNRNMKHNTALAENEMKCLLLSFATRVCTRSVSVRSSSECHQISFHIHTVKQRDNSLVDLGCI